MWRRLQEMYRRLVDPDRRSHLPAPAKAVARWAVVFWHQIVEDRAFNGAASLAFVTLIALVPMLLLVSGVLGATGLLERNIENVEVFLFSTFLADIPEVRTFIIDGLRRVDLGTLGIVGVVAFLIVNARLYFMAESFYNEIFGTPLKRSIGQRLLNFYFLLTAVPVALAAAVLGGQQVFAGTGLLAARSVSFLVTFGVLFVAIKLFPCTRVRWRAAGAGALVSTVLLEIGGRIFPLYVTLFATDDPLRILYGSLGLLPVFLIWLHVMWLFVLLGVEVAYVAQNFRSLVEVEGEQASRQHTVRVPGVSLALETATRIAGAFQAGEGPVEEERLAEAVATSIGNLRAVLHVLQEAGFVVQSSKGWLLSRPPGQIGLAEVASAWRSHTSVRGPRGDVIGDAVADALEGGLEGSLADGVSRWLSEARGAAPLEPSAS